MSVAASILSATANASFTGRAVATAAVDFPFALNGDVGFSPRFRIDVNGLGKASVFLSETVAVSITNISDHDISADGVLKFPVKLPHLIERPPRESATGSIFFSMDPGFGPFTSSFSCTPTDVTPLDSCEGLGDFGLEFVPIDVPSGGTINFTMTLQYAAEAQDVPEPASLLLLVPGLIGLVSIRNRRGAI